MAEGPGPEGRRWRRRRRWEGGRGGRAVDRTIRVSTTNSRVRTSSTTNSTSSTTRVSTTSSVSATNSSVRTPSCGPTATRRATIPTTPDHRRRRLLELTGAGRAGGPRRATGRPADVHEADGVEDAYGASGGRRRSGGGRHDGRCRRRRLASSAAAATPDGGAAATPIGKGMMMWRVMAGGEAVDDRGDRDGPSHRR